MHPTYFRFLPTDVTLTYIRKPACVRKIINIRFPQYGRAWHFDRFSEHVSLAAKRPFVTKRSVTANSYYYVNLRKYAHAL